MKFKIVLISAFFSILSNGAFAACNTLQACDDYSNLAGCWATQGVTIDGICYGTCSGGCESGYVEARRNIKDSCNQTVSIDYCEPESSNTCSSDSDCSSLTTGWLHGPNNTRSRNVGVCEGGACTTEIVTECEPGGSDSIGTYIYQ